MQRRTEDGEELRVVELFAGVGGFRLGLENADTRFRTVLSNQWEPSTSGQQAAECYAHRFGLKKNGLGRYLPQFDEDFWCAHGDDEVLWCADIGELTRMAAAEKLEHGEPVIIPKHDLLVGGFPCQDYSVAKPKNQAEGIRGKKGVLWWQIHSILRLREPRYVLLENVDRLLKSPANQRGRDFAILLASMSDLGYAVEWRVVNAAEYGFPQRRRRVFIFAELKRRRSPVWRPLQTMTTDGLFAKALPVEDTSEEMGTAGRLQPDFVLEGELHELTEHFGNGDKVSRFRNGGVMWQRKVWTRDLTPNHEGRRLLLRDIMQDEVPDDYYIDDESLARWAYLKGSKDEKRVHKSSGTAYRYQEGSMDWDRPDKPARTILTGEGGSGPSRFKHVVELETAKGKRYRRLTPEELEALNGFPKGWTDTGMSETRRAFCMGNALVVGVVERLGREIALRAFGDSEPPSERRDAPKPE